MSLNLDKRQRAMLREMGVRVWQPLAAPAEPLIAIKNIAVNVDIESGSGHFDQNIEVKSVLAAAAVPIAMPGAVADRRASPSPQAPVRPARPAEPAPAGSALACWRLGPAQALYADTALAGGARWLVLAETPPAGLQAPAFDGDAGRLLDNMLRAARLHQGGAVAYAPLVRQAIAGSMDELFAALAALASQARPDVVLVMGRLASQALLASGEAFGKLRGRPHVLQGCTAVVTHDAHYLLRCPQDKGKAWDDLCLAMSLAAASR